MSPSFSLVVALLLVLLNGFFVAAEFALVKVRATRIEELAQQGGIQARAVQRAMRHLDAYLSATQLGVTVASLALGWVGEPAFAHLIQPLFRALGTLSLAAAHATAGVFAFVVITFLHIVFGELAPKWLAIQRPEKMALWAAIPLQLFYWLFYPAIPLLKWSATAVLRVLGLGSVSHQ